MCEVGGDRMTGNGSASCDNDCFVTMPFSEQPGYATGHFRQIYDQIFRPAIMRAGFNPVRADDSKSAD
jgi:hypothetical protein